MVGRYVAAVILGVLGGILILSRVFSDIGRDESAVGQVVLLVSVTFLMSAGLGWLAARRWYLAVVLAWGAILMGAISLMVRTRRGGSPMEWLLTSALLLGIPALSLLGGFTGDRVRRWRLSRTAAR